MGNSGHWIAGMIRWAGGEDTLARDGTDSVRIAWDEVRRCEPEVIVISPCGFGTEQSFIQAQELKHLPGWASLPAVKNGRGFAVDGNSYFARPGPRLIEGLELLTHLIHPELFEWHGEKTLSRRWFEMNAKEKM